MFRVFVVLAALLSARHAVLGEHAGEEHHSEDAFTVAKEFLLHLEIEELENSLDGAGNITYDNTVKLVYSLLNRFQCPGQCEECAANITDHVFQVVFADKAYGLSEEAFHQSTVVLLYILSRENVFEACSPAGDKAVLGYIDGLLGEDDRLTEEELDEIFHEIEHNYKSSLNYKCFDVETIFEAEVADHEEGAVADELKHISPLIIANLLRGYCIGTTNQTDPHSFRNYIFEKYGHDGFISEERFEDMLASLSIGEIVDEHSHDEHGHEDSHDAHGDEDSHDAHDDEDSHDGHDHDKRSVNGLTRREVEDDHDHHEDEHSDTENRTIKCFTGEELLDVFGVDHEIGISEEEFTEVCPALIQQILSEACQHSDEDTDDTPSPLIWVYGTIAVLIISLGSLLGGLFVPCMSKGVYEKFIHSLIALAIAVLTGDAIIHLIPLALGIHAHEEGSHAVHSPFDPELSFAWKSLMTVVAIYAFYLLETLLGWFSGEEHTHVTDIHMTPHKSDDSSMTESQANLTKNMNAMDHDFSKRRGGWLTKYGALPVMVIVGDGLHNFADGLAIGAAFTAGIGPGLSTSLAVLFHELPHEFGDLAILLKAGLRLRWALLWNFLSAALAFGGLYVGIPLASTEVARQWIFAITAGMFIYVALADMMPQITHLKNVKDPGLTFVLQNIFFLLGGAFIFAIALYEDAIRITF